jgi:hypothetical protein
MAVMLRTIGVPSRVAVGFTPGKREGDVRAIGTSDAHAWVEAFFAGAGWLTFDPTPLGSGRAVTPSYLAEVPGFPSATSPPAEQSPPTGGQDDQAGGSTPQPSPAQSGGSPLPSNSSPGTGPDGASPQDEGPQPGDGGGAGNSPDKQDDSSGQDPRSAVWHAVLIGLLVAVLVIGVVAAPSTARRLARRKRMAIAAQGGVAGAAAAWRELLAESRDRGGQPPGNSTVRSAARRLVTTHRLDPLSSNAVRAVVGAVERGWYAPPPDSTTGGQLVSALRQIRTGLDESAPLKVLDRLWPRSARPRLPGRGRPSAGGYSDQSDPSTESSPADRFAGTGSRR